ncbi:estradiol 17-beta-dehydrogenase 11-like [Oppia nitens]|uniref:estradiol 17-beta-dehydrogenase 11-like n=1 Tax=Oppia nitens TaxID=1686743 RepID=UPI0023DBFED4|nr:estradiol 17-beta-dehydrogenase 11-like [Oppia nitens]
MILLIFNIFLWTCEVLTLLVKILGIFLEQLAKYVVPQPRKSIDGQIVVITGAGSGIGRQLSIRFAIQLNAVVVLWDINRESVERLNNEIRLLGGISHPMIVDVSDEKQVESAAGQVRQQIGAIHMLINNAGVVPCLPFNQLTCPQIRRTFDVNVLSHFWTIKQFLPIMEEYGRGHIVAIASSAGIMGSPYFTAYGSTKFGIVGLMSSLRKELHELDKHTQIKLTTICPLGISGTGINIPTRTRFPKILPIMTLDYAVDLMLDAILKEDNLVVLPFTFKLIFFVYRICPLKVSQLLFEFLDYAVEPPGFNAPIGRSHYHNNGNDRDYRNHH